MNKVYLLLLYISGILFAGVSGFAAEPVRVFVSIAPQAAFVEHIAGERAQVHVLVAPGESPATYSPTPRQMVELARSDLFFSIGVPFENGLLPKIQKTMKNLKIVDTRKGIRLRPMDAVTEVNEDEHPDSHDHDHKPGADDPHIWLDPILVKQQSRTMADALVAQDPEGEATYRKNLAAFEKKLDSLDGRIREGLKDLQVRKLFVFHPSYGYFCDRYGLEQIAVEIQGKEPTGRELAHFIQKAKDQNVKVIFIQPQFSDTAAQAIARAIDGAVLPLDPLARDYITNLETMSARIKQALSGQTEKTGEKP